MWITASARARRWSTRRACSSARLHRRSHPPESSDLAIRPFAEGVLKHGTTSIMTDLHEVGVVSGIEGIEAVLKENEATDLNLYFVVPSHVPFSPALETSGGSFNPDIIRKALQREDAVGISECVGPYILAGFPDLMESLDDVAGMKGMTAQGHWWR